HPREQAQMFGRPDPDRARLAPRPIAHGKIARVERRDVPDHSHTSPSIRSEVDSSLAELFHPASDAAHDGAGYRRTDRARYGIGRRLDDGLADRFLPSPRSEQAFQSRADLRQQAAVLVLPDRRAGGALLRPRLQDLESRFAVHGDIVFAL